MAFQNPPQRRSRLPLVLAAVVGVAAVVATYLLLAPDSAPTAKPTRRAGCVKLEVSASSEKAALMSEFAERYNRSGRTANGHCYDVAVHSKASGGAAEALARGWNEARDGAPVPDVWSPASSSWPVLLQQRLAIVDHPALIPAGKLPSIAQTPLVIAMPRPMAQALGWPKKPLGWSDVLGLTTNVKGWGAFGHPEWGRFKLGKTNPNFSTSGLSATVGTYFAATGRSSDLSLDDVSNPKVASFVKGVESGVVHYGDTTLTFLSNLAAAEAKGEGLTYISAVAVEEKSVYDYNQGNPTGDPKLFGKGHKPGIPLVAIYPKEGTLLSDNPYVMLSTIRAEKKAGAEDFLAFLRASAQQKRFQQLAFRGYQGKVGPAATEKNGILPGARFTVIDPPAPPVLQKVADSWSSLRKRARVLLVLDVSGSMQSSVGGGRSKLDLAKQAALSSLDQFAPDDEVGLWTFSTGATLADQPWTAQVPIAAVKDNKAALRRVIAGLAAEGGTALYRTTRDAQRTMLAQFNPARINAVVLLTDGKNEFPPDEDLGSLVEQLRGESPDTSVRVFPIAYGEQADLPTLKRLAEASQAAAYDASDPASIDKVLTAVISNF